MDKIKTFKEKALGIEVDVMQDYYPGNPIYIGKESDEKRDEYLKKHAAKNNIELPKIEGVLHYYPLYTSESQMESYYNDLLFLIPDKSLDYLNSELKELEAYSYKKLYDALDVLSSRFSNEEVMYDGARHDVMRFKNIFNRQFKNKMPISGRITQYFIGSMRKEMRLKEKYLEMLTNKVKDVIDIKMKNASTFTSLQSVPNISTPISNIEHINKFINEVKSVDVSVQKHYFIENVGILKEDEMPEGDYRHIKNDMLYVVNISRESVIKALHNNARFALAMLSKEQLENTLCLLQTYSFKNFYKELATYYKLLHKGEAHPMHETNFLLAMHSHLMCDVSSDGKITMQFLSDLMEEVGNKNGFLYALTKDAERLLGNKKELVGSTREDDVNGNPNQQKEKVSIVQPSTFLEEGKVNEEDKVNIKRLSQYFHLSFLGGNKYKANYLTENLVNDLKVLTDGKKVAHLALLIYDSKQINKLKPSTFSEWHTIFCECIDKNKVDYKRCKLKDLGQDFKEIFYYITPKIK